MRGLFIALSAAAVVAFAMMPCRASAATPLQISIEGVADPNTQMLDVGGLQVVVLGRDQQLAVTDPSAMPNDVYYADGDPQSRLVCPKTCRVALAKAATLDAFEQISMYRLVQGHGDAVAVGTFVVVRLPTAAVSVAPGSKSISAQFPDLIGTLQVTLRKADGLNAFPIAADVQLIPTDAVNTRISTVTARAIVSAGSPRTLSFDARVALATPLAISLVVSPRSLSGTARPDSPIVSQTPIGKLSVASIALASDGQTASLKTTATFEPSIFGRTTTLDATDAAISINSAGVIEPAYNSITWRARSPSFSFGDFVLTASDITVQRDAANAMMITVAHPSVASKQCGNATLADIKIQGNGLVVPSGSTAYSAGSKIPLPLAGACVTADDVMLTWPDFSKPGSLEFGASLTAPWLPAGASLTAAKVSLSFDAGVPSLQLTDKATFSYSGPPFVIADLAVTGLVATVEKNNSGFSLTGMLPFGTFSAIAKPSGFEASIKQAHFEIGGLRLEDADGKFSLGNTTSIALNSATLQIPLGTEGAKTPLQLAISQLKSDQPAIAADWNGKSWVRRSGGAAIDLRGGVDSASATLGPLSLIVKRYDGQVELLRSEFSGCAKHVATIDSETGAVQLCGQVRESATGSTVKNLCAYVGALYNPGKALQFSTIELPQTDPKSASVRPGCQNGFEFENMFRAHFETLTIYENLNGDTAVAAQAAATQSGSPTLPEACLPAKNPRYCMTADVLVVPMAGVPGISMGLFDSALFSFAYTNNRVALAGSITSLRDFSIPNVTNYKISTLEVSGIYDRDQKITCIALRAGDSSASLPGPLAFTVYGRGGGLEYHRDEHGSRWKTHFPGVKIKETLASAFFQLLSNAAAYSAITKGVKLKIK